MWKIAVVGLALMLAGCNSSGLSGPELASVQSYKKINEQLAREHKITWVEAERRALEHEEEVGKQPWGDQKRVLAAYKLSLASEVDAGTLTPEQMEYSYLDRVTQENKENQQRNQAQIDRSLEMFRRLAPPPTVNCTSVPFGGVVNTSCR